MEPAKPKEFVRASLTGVTVHPEDLRPEVRVREIPAARLPQPGSSAGLVKRGLAFKRRTDSLGGRRKRPAPVLNGSDPWDATASVQGEDASDGVVK